MKTTFPANRIAVAMVLSGLAVFFALAGPAAASEVHFDPESPAGKEYGLPLDQARNEAAGGESAESAAEAPLFGAGVSSGGSGTGQQGPEGHSAADHGKRAGGGREAEPGGSGGTGRQPQSAPSSSQDDSGASFGLGGAALFVLGIVLLAVLAGIALRAFLAASQRRRLGRA